MFSGFATFSSCCRACGLAFRDFNVGDGPAAFLALAVGGLITSLAIGLELTASPPLWVHLLLWVPLSSLAVLCSLRWAKAILLALEHRNGAREASSQEER